MDKEKLLDEFINEISRLYGTIDNRDPVLLLDKQLRRATDIVMSLAPLTNRNVNIGTYVDKTGARWRIYVGKWIYLTKISKGALKYSVVSPERLIEIVKEHGDRIVASSRKQIRSMLKESLELLCQLKTEYPIDAYEHVLNPPKLICILEKGLKKNYVEALKIRRELHAPNSIQVYVCDGKRYSWITVPYFEDSLSSWTVIIQLEEEIKQLMDQMNKEIDPVLKHNEKIIKQLMMAAGAVYFSKKLDNIEPELDSAFVL